MTPQTMDACGLIVRRPKVARHDRERAASMSGATGILETFEGEGAVTHWPAIGLLAVQASIALADAVLVATEGMRPATTTAWRPAGFATGAPPTAYLRRASSTSSGCSTRRPPSPTPSATSARTNYSAPEHLVLVGPERHVREDELQNAKLKMEQFFVWVFRTFPLVASTEPTDA